MSAAGEHGIGRTVVTGGGGFVGRAIALQLLELGAGVVSVSRGAHRELEELGVTCVRGDLGDSGESGEWGAWSEAFAGADVVFHVAAKAGVWGPREEYEHANVEGTRHVIEAARAHGVRRLVFTSSPSVCFAGTDHVMAGQDLPYAEKFLAPYPETKARAEAMVLAANGPELATCALRPHLVYGPGDPHLVPRLLDRAARGKLVIVGDGRNEVSLTHVDNAARAHVLAARTLAPGAPHAGRAYFIADERPVVLWKWIAELLESEGLPVPTRRISLRTAYRLGAACETLWRALPLPGEPPMTRFVAAQLATSHSYDMTPARRDFGYQASFGTNEVQARD